MKYYHHHDSYVMALATGEELMDMLNSFAQATNLRSAWLQGLGAATVIEIGHYSLTAKQYHWRKISGRLEVTNLTGNLGSVNGEPFWHVHGTFADDTSRAFGGHVRRLVVGGTCEILIRKLGQEMIRTQNRATGLNLLDSGD
jgi:uncharacterized protein